jgi:hypothetical protein
LPAGAFVVELGAALRLQAGSAPLLLVTSQDFIKFGGKFFAFVLLEMFENSQGFKIFESI